MHSLICTTICNEAIIPETEVCDFRKLIRYFAKLKIFIDYLILENQQNSQDSNSSAGRGIGRRGRGRGANNNNVTGQRREYQPRQQNQSQQTNEFMQMMDPPQQGYTQYYIPYNHYQYYGAPVPNAGGHVTGGTHMSHMNPTATSSANAHNLTGAPLYISPMPMYSQIFGYPPHQGVVYHPMQPQLAQQAYEQQQMVDDKEEGSNGPAPPPIMQQVWHPQVWHHNNVPPQQIGMPKQQMYLQQSPHPSDGEFQQNNEYVEEMHMQQMMESQNYQMMEQQVQQENVNDEQQMVNILILKRSIVSYG